MVDVFRNFLYFSDSLVIDMEDDEGRECHQDIRGGGQKYKESLMSDT